MSGVEVPKPTITMPMSSGDMPQCRAVAAAPFTNRSALHTRSGRPAAMRDANEPQRKKPDHLARLLL